MHPAQRALAFVERDIALRHVGIQPAHLELVSAKTSCEKSTLILVPLRFDHKRARQLRLRENQVCSRQISQALLACSTAALSAAVQRRLVSSCPEVSRP